MSKIGYFLGGSLLGAVGLGALSFLVTKYCDSPSVDDSCLDGEDEPDADAILEAQSESIAVGDNLPAEGVA